MSKYTTEVRFICENYAGLDSSAGYNDVTEIIRMARPKIFNFNYPIFDDSYKDVIETKILKHFYTREIGFETVGLWKLKLDTLLNEIMPYYNKLYSVQIEDINPLYLTDMHRVKLNKINNNKSTQELNTGNNSYEGNDKNSILTENHSTQNNNGVGVNMNKSDKLNYNLYSDTPQGSLNGVDNETYLTNARKDSENIVNNSADITNFNGANDDVGYNMSDSTSKNSTNFLHNKQIGDVFSGVEDYIENVYGKDNKLTATLIKEYADNLLNIDMMVIKNLEPLFMQLW